MVFRKVLRSQGSKTYFKTFRVKINQMEDLIELTLSDFSEADTSDTATDPSVLSGFDDFKKIISDTDTMKQNLPQRKIKDNEPPMVVTVTGDLSSEMEIFMSIDQKNIEFEETKAVEKVMNPLPRFPCVVCRKVFKDEEEMKHHVLKTHLRPVVFCSECGKGVSEDEILQHKKTSCSLQVKH